MKITLKAIDGSSKEIQFNSMPTVLELRNVISKEMQTPWYQLEVANIFDRNKNKVGTICYDDCAELRLDELLKSTSRKPIFNEQFNDLTIWVNRKYGMGHFRHTYHNPRGFSAKGGLEDQRVHPTSTIALNFFKSALKMNAEQSFSERCALLGIQTNEVPRRLLCPITHKIMDNPVIASDQRTYDLAYLKKVNYISPYTNEVLSKDLLEPNLLLRSEFENFLLTKQYEDIRQKEANIARRAVR